MRILECSSKGDIRFSAFGADVHIFGKTDKIEFLYQLSKRVEGVEPPRTDINLSRSLKMDYLRKVKGKLVKYIHVNGIDLPAEMLTPYYKFLWLLYLDNNPALVQYAEQFDGYNDMFGKRAINNQAKVIEQYIRKGRQSLIDECWDFMKAAKIKFPLNIGNDILLKYEVNSELIDKAKEVNLQLDLGKNTLIKLSNLKQCLSEASQEAKSKTALTEFANLLVRRPVGRN